MLATILLALLPGCATNTADETAAIAASKLGDAVTQLVVVTSAHPDCTSGTASLYARSGGNWRRIQGPYPAALGRSGIAADGEKREGDGKTPAGVFELGPAFGYAATVPTKLPYRQAGADDVWVDDPSAPDYNRWTTRQATRAASFERMHRDDALYELGVVIGYNAAPVRPGAGSAIFLHVRAPGEATAGCVALDAPAVRALVGQLDAKRGAAIVIATRPTPEVSITMDDFDAQDATKLGPDARNDAILAALAKHKVHAALFVSCKNLRGPDDWRRLGDWSASGQLIANHTFSHLLIGPELSAKGETDDIQRCDDVLAKVPGYARRFRYPFLAEGDTPQKRDAVRDWLAANRYRSGAVTIDASDWYVDQRLRERLAKDENADVSGYRDFYLEHLWGRAQYYDGLSNALLGRSVKHTLLVHFNLLNALFLDDVLAMFESHGWKVIDASTAFADPVFAEKPPAIMPAGQSLLWTRAKAKGMRDLRFPAEDGRYEKAEMDRRGL